MSCSPTAAPIRFKRGARVFEISVADGGVGYVGRRDGRLQATAPDAASVARALIMAERWHR